VLSDKAVWNFDSSYQPKLNSCDFQTLSLCFIKVCVFVSYGQNFGFLCRALSET